MNPFVKTSGKRCRVCVYFLIQWLEGPKEETESPSALAFAPFKMPAKLRTWRQNPLSAVRTRYPLDCQQGAPWRQLGTVRVPGRPPSGGSSPHHPARAPWD